MPSKLIDGVGATDANLSSYGRKGVNTPLAIARKWAPSGDGDNDPQAYAQHIAGALGIGVDDPINLNDTATRARLRDAMFSQEGTNQGPFAGAQAGSARQAPAMAPAGGPLAADSKGNPVETNPDGVAVQNQTASALHAANAARRAPQPAMQASDDQTAPGPQAPQGSAQPQGAVSPQLGSPLDPSMGGIVSQREFQMYGSAGGVAQHLHKVAMALSMSPQFGKAAETAENRAKAIDETLRMANTPQPAIKEYELGRQPGETIDQHQARKAGEVKGAEEKAGAPYNFVERMGSDGNFHSVPLTALTGNGATLQSQIDSAPISKYGPAVQAGQEEVTKFDNAIPVAMQVRQEARQRLQAISDILESYESGAFAEERAGFWSALHAAGIPVSEENLRNSANFEKFLKDSTANVFAEIKAIGGQPRVAEMTGLTKAMANPDLQPDAARAIVGQGIGLLNYADKYATDFSDWHKNNPNASSMSQFETAWVPKHSPVTFVDAATKDVAVKGDLPSPRYREDGQSYMTPQGKQYWDATKQQFLPPAPKVGAVKGSFRYTGGNPAQQSSWERVQ